MNSGHSCKEGFFPITSSWQACEEAAKAIGFTTHNNIISDVQHDGGWGTSRPQGCFQSDRDDKIHFNRGAGGNSIGSDKILCRIGRKNS